MALAPVMVNPDFLKLFAEVQRIGAEGIAAAAADDVEKLHELNHQILSVAVNLSHWSFFGLTVKRINDQLKKQQAEPELNLDSANDQAPANSA